MGSSNGAWGELAEHDDELAEVWDGFEPIPQHGENEALDTFVERKRLSHAALVRAGARLAESTVLAFAGPGWMKFRDVVTDRRWSYVGSDWSKLKLLRAALEPTTTVIVAEGESDGMRLSDGYTCDIAILPAGAGYFPESYADQLRGYEQVLVGLDNDAAGERGAAAILAALPQAQRFAPPAGDWCEADELPPVPSPETRVEMQVLVNADDLLNFEPPPVISWYEHALLPVAGQMILHGWAKSFKTFLGIDLLSALSQGQDWCGFEPTEEPCRVAVMQYEVPWGYYQQRVRLLQANAREPELFGTNFLTFTPMQRPNFTAGNVAQEDFILKTLETHDVQVFLLDPIRRATGLADLNSEREVRPLLHFFERLQDSGVTVVTTHHDNKTYSRQGGGDPLGMTGVGAFAGDADTIVSVSIPKGMTIEEPIRNLHFTLRNAPSISARGMRMGEDGHIVYSTSAYDNSADDDGTDRPTGPPI